jgi:membrane protein DedA with SNARE-associated domain
MSLSELISNYGYFAIAIGTFFEGETVLVLGGFAAHRGYLELQWVITWAFLGTLFGDQLYYYIGRSQGMEFINRRPHWQARSARVFRLLHQHQILLILGFRFLYGLRTVTPFLIGASGIARLRFTLLNLCGAFVWAVAIGILGYVFGQTFELLLDDIKRYELWLFGGLAIVGVLMWWFYRYRKKPPKL